MRTIAPRTNFACRYRHGCVYCLHECLVCATVSFWPLMPPGASGHARTHALHVHIIAYTFYPRAWSLRSEGLALDQPFWLFGNSLFLRRLDCLHRMAPPSQHRVCFTWWVDGRSENCEYHLNTTRVPYEYYGTRKDQWRRQQPMGRMGGRATDDGCAHTCRQQHLHGRDELAASNAIQPERQCSEESCPRCIITKFHSMVALESFVHAPRSCHGGMWP